MKVLIIEGEAALRQILAAKARTLAEQAGVMLEGILEAADLRHAMEQLQLVDAVLCGESFPDPDAVQSGARATWQRILNALWQVEQIDGRMRRFVLLQKSGTNGVDLGAEEATLPLGMPLDIDEAVCAVLGLYGVPVKRYEPHLRSQGHPRITLPDLQPGHHLCSLYETEEEQRALLTPFLRQGLERGEKVIYAVHARTVESALGYLQEDGLDVGPYLARGQLAIVAAESIYLRERVFSPEEMIRLLGTETERALAEGYAGLRGAAEMTWALENPPGSHRLIEYEAMVNTFFPSSKCVGLCFYDQRLFPPRLLLDILHTHPAVAIGSAICANFDYVPPEEFRGSDANGALLWNYIRRLAERRGLELELRDAREQLKVTIEEKIMGRRKARELSRSEDAKRDERDQL